MRIAILASGTGSNTRNLLEFYQSSTDVEIALIASNNPNAGVLNIAAEYGVQTFLLNKQNFAETNEFLQKLKQTQIDFVVLAGFLWKVPESLVSAYPNKIINIHPALLPKYGGKGMYGHHVHEAVFQNGEKESGITVHFVNEHYDEGAIIAQKKVSIGPEDSPAIIEAKVRKLEIEFFPEILNSVFVKSNNIEKSGVSPAS